MILDDFINLDVLCLTPATLTKFVMGEYRFIFNLLTVENQVKLLKAYGEMVLKW